MEKPVHPRFAVSLAALTCAAAIGAQGLPDFTLSAIGSAMVPLGPRLQDGLVYFDVGGGGGIQGEWSPSALPFAFLRAGIEADQLAVKKGSTALTIISAGGALGLSWSPISLLSLEAFGGGGMYMGIVEAGSVRNPFWEAGAGLKWILSPTISLKLGGRYRDYYTPNGSLLSGLSIFSGLSFDLAGDRKGNSLKAESRLLPVFPLFYTYYDKNPAGTVLIRNEERVPLETLKASIYVRQYMDGPRTFAELPSLAPKASAELPVYALFNDQIFRVTEGTKSAGEIIFEYYYLGTSRKLSFPVTVTVNNRNALTWDDDRKAAAFVAAKNPAVLGFAKGFAANARAAGAGILSNDFRIAIALFEALRLHGLGYAVDPSTPYASLSATEDAIDFIQYPQQTLAYKAGDCDDLSVLYAALLEASGLRSAFVLTPGHIFIAFDSGLTSEMASRVFSSPDDYIERDGSAWLPIEVTMLRDGFAKAWRRGLKEWREADAAGTLSYFQTREAWKLYEPIGIASDGISFILPDSAAVSGSYKTELDGIIAELMKERLSTLKKSISSGESVGPNLNKLGVLYARFGFMEEAKSRFTEAADKNQNTEALVNLGSMASLENRPADAAAYYERALQLAPDGINALVGLARARKALGDQAAFDAAVARLKEVNPASAVGLENQAAVPAIGDRQGDMSSGEALWTE